MSKRSLDHNNNADETASFTESPTKKLKSTMTRRKYPYKPLDRSIRNKPFGIFLAEKYKEYQGLYGQIPDRQLLKKWKEMSDEEKEPYETESRRLTTLYDAKVAKYNQQHPDCATYLVISHVIEDDLSAITATALMFLELTADKAVCKAIADAVSTSHIQKKSNNKDNESREDEGVSPVWRNDDHYHTCDDHDTLLQLIFRPNVHRKTSSVSAFRAGELSGLPAFRYFFPNIEFADFMERRVVWLGDYSGCTESDRLNSMEIMSKYDGIIVCQNSYENK